MNDCTAAPASNSCTHPIMDWNLTSSEMTFSEQIRPNLSLTLPLHLTFTRDSLIRVSVYGILFVVAAVGNLTVLITLLKNRRRRSRINMMILHLAVADLIVTFIMIPLEMGWRLTVQWVAGEVACRTFLFLRAFGLYLSSMVLVCVSLDRYFAILHPLKVNDAQRRGKIMLLFAWTISILCSVPQSVVFHVQRHPDYPFFEQCVTFNSFPTDNHELAYNMFCMLAMYGVPLLVIVFVYTRILCEISNKSRETRDELERDGRIRGRFRLRRSDMTNIERARARTLRMTIIIVIAFIWCWTPYFVMTMWYMFDRESATQVNQNSVDERLQESLFMFAVSNSCVNPLVYGSYAVNFRREYTRCLCCKKNLRRKTPVPA
uniref:G-protein coupled receptors family 1 profile domain-containing protein n=1 Tax=Strigamia maritima TaxID=126957 RepID=T1J812_STRMM